MLQENWILNIIENIDVPNNLKYTLHEIMLLIIEKRDALQTNEKKIVTTIKENIATIVERRFKNESLDTLLNDIIIDKIQLEQVVKKRIKNPFKLFEVQIQNFRQFLGVQTVKFSQDEEKSITVLRGENGSGKSNFLNAITWCLYGIEIIQPENLKNSPILTFKLGHEIKLNEQAEVKVILTIGKLQPEIRVIRRVLFKRSQSGDISPVKNTEEFSVYLFEDPVVGWKESKSPLMILNKVIPKKFLEFFFFDGEQITKYFSTGGERGIDEAIQTVTDLKLLLFTSSFIQSILRAETQKLARLQPNTGALAEKIEMNDLELQRHVTLIQQTDVQLNTIEKEIAEVENNINVTDREKINSLQKQQSLLDENLTQFKKDLELAQTTAKKELIYLLPYAILHQHFLKFLDITTQKTYAAGEISPQDYSLPLLEKILANDQCICGEKLSSSMKETLLALKNRTETSSHTERVFKTDSLLNIYYKKQFFDDYGRYMQFRQKAGELEDNIEMILTQLHEVKTLLAKSATHEQDELETQYNHLIKTRDDFLLKKGELEGVCKQLRLELDKDKKELEKSILKEKESKHYDIILKVYEALKRSIDQIYEYLIEFVRTQIEELTSEYFKELTWKKDAFKCVKIDKSYHIHILNAVDDDLFRELSAGERQILAYAFIGALTTISGFEAPVIIDTPLGKISDLPRKNIANSLPNFLKKTQITFLFTDAEFTTDVRTKMQTRVGCEYSLNYHQESETCTIDEVKSS